MRLSAFLAAIGLAPLATFAQAPDASPTTPVEITALPVFEPSREDAVLEAYVDGVVGAHMRANNIPGVTVSVVREGRTVFAKGYGRAKLDDATPVDGRETLFRIGSVTKTFVWTSVMMLAEQGRLDLDADINTYLNDIQIPEKFGAPITMNHLMAHRAGFEDSFQLYTREDGENELPLTVALAEDMPSRVYPPGARTAYSNYGSALAARIVENITEQSIETFIQDSFLTPLDMSSTTLNGPSEMTPARREVLSDGFVIKNGAQALEAPMQLGPYAPAGAMAASAADMALWMQFHLGQGAVGDTRLMRADTHRKMWSRAFSDRAAAADLAHGFFNRPYRGYQLYSHGGGTAAFITNMTMVPELNVGVFVSQNAIVDRALIDGLSQNVIDFILKAEAQNTLVINGAERATTDYVGSYMTNRRIFTKFLKIAGAQSVVQISPGEDGALVENYVTGATIYLPTEIADVYESHNGERLYFGRNEKGAVAYLVQGRGVVSFEKVGFFDGPLLLSVGIGGAALFAVTTLLGAWRRQGRQHAATPTGKALSVTALVSAVTVIAFLATLIAFAMAMSSESGLAILRDPPFSMSAMRSIAVGVVIAAFIGVISLLPAWTRSGWSIFRKLHHTLFVSALSLMTAALIVWNFVFVPMM